MSELSFGIDEAGPTIVTPSLAEALPRGLLLSRHPVRPARVEYPGGALAFGEAWVERVVVQHSFWAWIFGMRRVPAYRLIVPYTTEGRTLPLGCLGAITDGDSLHHLEYGGPGRLAETRPRRDFPAVIQPSMRYAPRCEELGPNDVASSN